MFAFRRDPVESGVPGVGVAFTDRHDGHSSGSYASFNLGRVGQDPAAPDNLETLRTTLRLRSLMRVDQKHTAIAQVTTDNPDGSHRVPGDADALVTTQPGVGLVIRVADCLPVLFASADGSVIGAAHAGRVGLLTGILTETVRVLREQHPAPAGPGAALRAWIGPHICGDCYEVPEEMRREAAQILPASHATTSWGTPAIDLAAGAEQQLIGLDVAVEQVGECTRTNPQDLFSHRVDANAGRQAGVVFRR